MTIREFLRVIDSFAPFALAESWDNSGLMFGSYDSDVKRVAIALDPVAEAVISASENHCDVLLTHHPLIFRAIKNINLDSDLGRAIYEAARRDVSIISAHTNWDSAESGVNATLAELLGLREVSRLTCEANYGLVGNLPEKISLEDLLMRIKSCWNLSRLDCYNPRENLRRVALCGGSGAEFWRAARDSGADIYVTADMKYHEIIDATKSGLTLAIPEHGEMERASLPKLAEKIRGINPELEIILLDVKALREPIRI